MLYRFNKRIGRLSLPRWILEVVVPGEKLAAGQVSLHHCCPDHGRHCPGRVEC